MKRCPDLIVIGGGIIGLSIATELANVGMAVTLIEQGVFGGEASVAAAGMLAPLKEFTKPGPLLDMGIRSLQMYENWVLELKEATGIDCQLSTAGILTVAMTDMEEEWLQERYQWQKSEGYDIQLLSTEEVQEREPHLSKMVRQAIYSPHEADINNRLLLKALVIQAEKRNVHLLQNTTVIGLKHAGKKITGVVTDKGEMEADHVIVASGAWTADILHQVGVDVPVYPVRGQIAAVDSIHLPLSHVVFGKNGYLVPKQDRRIIVGATEDLAGFDRSSTVYGVSTVLKGALSIVPAISEAPFLQAWAGLRPATADGCPILGPVPDWTGLTLACGHYRNGILLAPLTAKLIAEYVSSDETEHMSAFLPDRFRLVSYE
ncbi:glycine oxidase ThiO [Brevibacillus laterosporus]|uniref:glycine oxidase n=1 Tax=Brevibacillus laterosporus TaxID=1465 RepID=A0AAP3DID8_BRELA|nr:glycine oxidase ThiO [Brevibacillus laterosporus]MCR8980480.1 glycine oxidase ThiO [Brevibacillus laterosporus]MCZ0807635.1 glycine oxidase ThiO [Brevibacillus laterosporus]MCZ0827072.1 glycine oxidase ThiO [Brevibacillus laterosporus]MCZ0851063.1 glycine oxidase ThiO [Brevibacillus laterosporus]